MYRGTLEGLEIERGHNTFWIPEILWAGVIAYSPASSSKTFPQAKTEGAATCCAGIQIFEYVGIKTAEINTLAGDLPAVYPL